jgi:hypothetical protein
VELLIRSNRKDNKTGYKGVNAHQGRFQAKCNISPCRNNYLGRFGTPEDAAQAYLQHYQKEHAEQQLALRVQREAKKKQRDAEWFGGGSSCVDQAAKDQLRNKAKDQLRRATPKPGNKAKDQLRGATPHSMEQDRLGHKRKYDAEKNGNSAKRGWLAGYNYAKTTMGGLPATASANTLHPQLAQPRPQPPPPPLPLSSRYLSLSLLSLSLLSLCTPSP